MQRRARQPRTAARSGHAGRLAALASASALLLPAAVAAEPPATSPAAAERRAAASPLAAPAKRAGRRPPTWMGEHMHFKKGAGFEYRRALRMGETPLELGVQGPVVRKKKRLGVTFVVRF